MLHIVPRYAALFALMFIVLAVRVIRTRQTRRVIIGTGQDQGLERRIRVHANFAEYVPFALLLLAMAELRGAAPPPLHILCLVLLVGRVLHAWGVSRQSEDLRFRTAGMVSTFGALAGASLLLLL